MKNIELSVMQHQHIPHRDCFILSDITLLENTKMKPPSDKPQRETMSTQKKQETIYMSNSLWAGLLLRTS
jgi:hypothetical protein